MTHPVRIPANVDREDTVLAGLTARQLLILSLTGMTLYVAWQTARAVVPLAVFALLALPVAVIAAALALGRRDGLSLDRLVLAAVRQRLAPRVQVAAPEGVAPVPAWLAGKVSGAEAAPAPTASPAPGELPVAGVSEAGLVDLGPDGVALVAVCSTVNFSLRTPAEQQLLVTSFGRYLHSLTAPVQVLARTERLDLTGQIAELHTYAPGLPHPALEAAAREHADFLAQLGRDNVLLRRQILLVLREPVRPAGPTDGLGGASPLAVLAARRRATRDTRVDGEAARRAAGARLLRRVAEATELLSPAGISVTCLDAGQATGVLAAACNPGSMIAPSTALAGADDIITLSEGWDAEADEPPGRAA